MKSRLPHPGYFKCLNSKDVISAKVSDHHPIIHDGALFWNMMMQGKLRHGRMGSSYNNGLGVVETDDDYINRLVKIANVIAEIMDVHPNIDVICICEGPIQSLHVETFLHSLKKYHSIDKFKDIFYKSNAEGFPNWGLLMLADKKYEVSCVKCDFIDHAPFFKKSTNRFQIWKLTNDKEESKYLALGHFPLGGDERVAEKKMLSAHGSVYCDLVRNVINYYSNEQFILCADFNLNPYLISEWQDRAQDLITNNNSILLTNAAANDVVTVDGIYYLYEQNKDIIVAI